CHISSNFENMATEGCRADYQPLPSNDQETSTRNRPISPDSLDADTEASSSENEDVTKAQPSEEPEDGSDKPGLSNNRRICLVGSLLLCVFTVFAFAFILPCHHKTCLKETKCKEPKNWSKNFSGVAPLVLREFSGDSRNASSAKHVLVGFSHTGRGFHMLNHTCPGCHGGVVAVNGRNGRQLWTSGILGKLGNILCDLSVKNQSQQSCIALENGNKILRIDSHSGYQNWTVERPGKIRAFRTIRDIDNDGVGEIVLLHGPRSAQGTVKRAGRSRTVSEISILSGKSGQAIGISLPVLKHRSSTANPQDLRHDGFLRVHQLTASAQVLLIGVKLESEKTGTLLAIKVEELATRVHNKTQETSAWGPKPPNRYGFVELFKDTLVLTPPLFADLNNDGVEDIVLCTLDGGLTVKALNGKDSKELWSRKLTSRVIHRSLPAVVSFGDKVTDIAIMIQLNNRSTRIVVLNGRNGLALWMFSLNHPLMVPPVGVPQSKGVPRGLLLWLPRVKVNEYLSKRNLEKYRNTKNRRDGPRKRRNVEYDGASLLDGLLQELYEEIDTRKNALKSKTVVERNDAVVDGDNDDGDDDVLASELLQAKSETVVERNGVDEVHDGDDADHVLASLLLQAKSETTAERNGVDEVHDGDADVLASLLLQAKSETTAERNGVDEVDRDDDNLRASALRQATHTNTRDNDSGDDNDDVSRHNDDVGNAGKTDDDVAKRNYVDADEKEVNTNHRDDDDAALRNFLKHLENRLRRETSKGAKPSPSPRPTIPGTQTESPTTQEAETQSTTRTTAETKLSSGQDDKPALTCDEPWNHLGNKDISAVLVYRDSKHRLQIIDIVEESVINIAPEQYINKFGRQPPVADSCIQFVPIIRTKPIVTDINGDGRLDLIYAVDYVTSKPSSSSEDRVTHLMKLRKVDILEKITDNKRKVFPKFSSTLKKNYKRNKEFESPFSRWSTE
ncbi:hypothetical protein QZH41_019049, partial [Actinostola sp. cb2023]